MAFPRISFYKNYSFTPETTLNRRGDIETPNPRLKILDNFDPENKPNETSAVYTRFGWFYIPTEFYLDGKIGVEIQNSLDDNGVTSQTPKSEIQRLILEWCRDQPYETKKKYTRKRASKKEAPEVILDRLFNDAKNGSVGEHKHEPTVEGLPYEIEKAMLKVTSRSVFAKFDESTGKYEIKGAITQGAAYQYYLSKEWNHFRDLYITIKKTREALGKAWKNKTPEEREAMRLEFLEMLKNGKDLVAGKIVPLELRLTKTVFNDGYRLRVRSDYTKYLLRLKNIPISRES